jgi:glycine cleavage system H lipoate-binding protein
MVALFVVLTFLFFILIDLLILKAQGKEHPAFAVKVFDKRFFFPTEAILSTGHLWLHRAQNGLYKLGIDEFILKALGKLHLIPLKAEGASVNKGEPVLQAVFGNRIITFRAPVDGSIKFVNKNIYEKPVDDPYGDDWAMLIEPKTNIPLSTTFLKTGNDAIKWLHDEFNRFKDFVAAKAGQPELAGVTLQDGGNIVEGVLRSFDDKTIKEFEEQFL